MRHLLISIVVIFQFSCTNDENPDIAAIITTSSHFPQEIGHSVSYNVQEIIYYGSQIPPETLNYQLKEDVVDSFTDDTGATVYVVDRYTRMGPDYNWVYLESWQSMINGNQAIRIEENKRFIKLRLPIKQDDQWNGNALFDASSPITIGRDPIDYYKNWASELIETNSTISLGDQTYSGVHTVSLANEENRLELRFAREMYADGIGLIKREIRVLDTQCFDGCESTAWEDKAENGHVYIQTIMN